MLDRTENIAAAAENWLTQFETALAAPNEGALETLFQSDSYWRDVLALSWNIQTINGADAILSELKTHARRALPSGFAVHPDRRAPRKVMACGHQLDRGDFQIRDKCGTRQRHRPPDP